MLICITCQHFTIVWLVGFSTSSLATRLYLGRVPRLTSDNCTCSHTETKRKDHDFCLSQPNQLGAGGRSRDRIQGLLARSRALYRLTHRALRKIFINVWIILTHFGAFCFFCTVWTFQVHGRRIVQYFLHKTLGSDPVIAMVQVCEFV